MNKGFLMDTTEEEARGRESEAGGLKSAAVTHTGHRRPHNEDTYGVFPDTGLFVVADGMGGHEAGEVASRVVVDHVASAVERGETLEAAVHSAHLAVLEAVEAGEGRSGMGSTVVAAKFLDGDFEVAWAGDSRAYQAGRELRRITRDHSLVQEMVDSGNLSEGEARNHPERSLITRALGMPGMDELEVASVTGRLGSGERLLLCSDGLTEELDDPAIKRLLDANPDPERAVRALLEAALSAGGSDNITVLLVQAPGRPGGRARAMRLVAAALFGLAAALAVSLVRTLL